MHALALAPMGYVGSYKLIGGCLAFDFINTISWPNRDQRHDWLSTTANVSAWLTAVGLETGDVADADLASIHRLRAIISEAVTPLAHRSDPDRTAIDALNAALSNALARRRIDHRTLRWAWRPAATTLALFDPVVLDAARILDTGDRDRLKHCPSCDWVFEDQTRNGRRRWCDMADCGSRAKSRDYYHRNKQ